MILLGSRPITLGFNTSGALFHPSILEPIPVFRFGIYHTVVSLTDGEGESPCIALPPVVAVVVLIIVDVVLVTSKHPAFFWSIISICSLFFATSAIYFCFYIFAKQIPPTIGSNTACGKRLFAHIGRLGTSPVGCFEHYEHLDETKQQLLTWGRLHRQERPQGPQSAPATRRGPKLQPHRH